MLVIWLNLVKRRLINNYRAVVSESHPNFPKPGALFEQSLVASSHPFTTPLTLSGEKLKSCTTTLYARNGAIV